MTDVVIVGGGPVGMALAIDLGQRGAVVEVVEKEPDLHDIPKGQNLTQRTMEHFATWGVDAAIRQERLMPDGFPASGVNAWKSLLSGHSYPWFKRSDVSSFYFERNERLPQYLTEKVLRQRVASLPTVSVRYGVEALGVRDDGDSVVVATTDGDAVGKWAVGCDGSRSVVRRTAGIPEEVRDHDRRMVLAVFRSSRLFDVLSQEFGQASFYNVLHPDLDGYWRFLGTVDVAEQWFFHAPVPGDAVISERELGALLHETVGTEFEIEFDYIGFWDLRVAIAEKYRLGRVFVAGDAAHSHPPYGGYGINTGFEDARNLGWKLGAVLAGWAGPELLDSYEAERRRVFISTAEDFIESFIERDRRFIELAGQTADSESFSALWEDRRDAAAKFGVADYAPHYVGSPIVLSSQDGSPSARGAHEHTVRSGLHLTPPDSDSQLHRTFGSQFTLITDRDMAHLGEDFARVAADRKIPFESVVTDTTRYGCSAVLVRPDGYVAWTDEEETVDAATILGTSSGDIAV